MNRLASGMAVALVSLFVLAPPSAAAAWVWPLRGELITPYRNGGDPYAGGQHRGIDIAGPVGAPVVAAVEGEVRFAGVVGSSGLTVSVRTADGRYDTSYLHLSAALVHAGDGVDAGQRLGAVGISGQRSAEAPHLHFGVRDAGSRQAYHDPLELLPPLASTPERDPAPPVPAPLALPAPVPVPSPAARRVPAAERRRVPIDGRGRVPVTERRGLPAAEGRRLPASPPRRVPAGEGRRMPTAGPQRGPGAVLRRMPALDPGRGETPRVMPRATLDRSQQARGEALVPAERNGHGASDAGSLVGTQPHGPAATDGGSHHATSRPDAGWALACLGLLLAATLVGTGGGGRDAARRSGSALGRALRPLGER